MELKYDHNRIYVTDDEEKVIAEITYPEVEAGVVDIDHTYVDDSLRGQGVAGKLVTAAYDSIKKDNKKAVLTCPYAVKWFENHPDKNDIIKK